MIKEDTHDLWPPHACAHISMYTNHTNTPHTNCNNFFILRSTFHCFYFLKSPFLLLVFFFKASMEENKNSNGSLGVLPSPSLSAYAPPPESYDWGFQGNKSKWAAGHQPRVSFPSLFYWNLFTKLQRALRIIACFRVNREAALRGFYAWHGR